MRIVISAESVTFHISSRELIIQMAPQVRSRQEWDQVIAEATQLLRILSTAVNTTPELLQ
jgi:hypothetical protein